jgi:hypothetical protein
MKFEDDNAGVTNLLREKDFFIIYVKNKFLKSRGRYKFFLQLLPRTIYIIFVCTALGLYIFVILFKLPKLIHCSKLTTST